MFKLVTEKELMIISGGDESDFDFGRTIGNLSKEFNPVYRVYKIYEQNVNFVKTVISIVSN